MVREAKVEDKAETSLVDTETFHSNSTSQMENTENSTSLSQEGAKDDGNVRTENSGNGHSDGEDGFVVYAKHGEEDLVEVDKKVWVSLCCLFMI